MYTDTLAALTVVLFYDTVYMTLAGKVICMEPEDVARQLREAWDFAWEPTMRLFGIMESRTTTPRYTTVEKLQSMLKLSRRDTAEMVKGIEQAGVGRRIVGRRGAKSRILWSYTWNSIARVARGDGGSEDLKPTHEAPSEPARVEHSYVLREEEEPIRVKLPRDLTQREADRFAMFIRSLPKK